VVVCVVPSFAASLLATATLAAVRPLARRRLVLWIQDLVLLAALSLADVGPRARRLLDAAARLEPVAPRAADAVVVCSPGFAARPGERLPRAARVGAHPAGRPAGRERGREPALEDRVLPGERPAGHRLALGGDPGRRPAEGKRRSRPRRAGERAGAGGGGAAV